VIIGIYSGQQTIHITTPFTRNKVTPAEQVAEFVFHPAESVKVICSEQAIIHIYKSFQNLSSERKRVSFIQSQLLKDLQREVWSTRGAVRDSGQSKFLNRITWSRLPENSLIISIVRVYLNLPVHFGYVGCVDKLVGAPLRQNYK